MYLSLIVAGELLYGFRNGAKFLRNVRDLDEFLARPTVSVVPVTMATADRYSRIFAALRAKGTPIPTNDVWIAAQAIEAGAELITFDAHFAVVDGLSWTSPEE